jgi:CheY-like chemotaxis protein
MARILVVDDDDDLRRVLARMLVAAGHEVVEVAGGGQAIEAYRTQPCDLVLSDIYMPGVDGVEAIIRLRAEFPDIRIVAVSGGGYRDKDEVLDIAARLGARATLTKPLERRTLLKTVERVLKQA